MRIVLVWVLIEKESTLAWNTRLDRRSLVLLVRARQDLFLNKVEVKHYWWCMYDV